MPHGMDAELHRRLFGLPVVAPVETFFAELQANARPATTIRSYGMDLLRWWRFLSGWGVAWDRASRRDARDFARWMQIAPKVSRVHWRPQASGETQGVFRSASPTRARK